MTKSRISLLVFMAAALVAEPKNARGMTFYLRTGAS